jgi:hypothetical protein
MCFVSAAYKIGIDIILDRSAVGADLHTCLQMCHTSDARQAAAHRIQPWYALHALLQARVKEQETQKKLFNIKRVVCIGGGVALVLVAWALLVASSGRSRVDPGGTCCITTFIHVLCMWLCMSLYTAYVACMV